MVKDDKIYQVLLKHNFDLYRGDKGIAEYMTTHLSSYYEEIVSATEDSNPFLGDDFIAILKSEISHLKSICEKIPQILRIFDNGHIPDAYSMSGLLFDEIKPYLLSRFSWSGDAGDFYRIRSGDFRINDPKESKQKKAELFHIKKTMRNRIGAYRYSVAGYPCLYLSSNKELAWFECGMPKQFSYCHLALSEDGENALRLVDFSWRPMDILSSVTIWILNARRQNKELNEIKKFYDFLIKYIITYPLMAACSVRVKDRGSKFVEEYIFPQMFMYWIRESSDIDGVRYKSSLDSTLVQGMGAINVALPVKNFREDGLDERLTTRIGVSDIGYLDVNSDFKRYKDTILEFKLYINKLRTFIIESPCAGDYVVELIDLAECIIKTYTALMDGNYTNSELIFTYVDNLSDHVDLLYQCRKVKIEEYIEMAKRMKKEPTDSEVIESHFHEFRELAEKILRKHTVFDFSFESLGNIEFI